MNDEHSSLSLWIGDLGKYAEGQLVGEWIELPCDDFESAFRRIGIDPKRDEWFCADWDCYIPGLEYSEYPSFDRLDELNDYAEKWDALSDREREIAGVYMQEFGEDLDGAIENIDNAIVWHGCSSMADVARESLEACGGVSSALDPDTIERYFNCSAFARDIEYSGDMTYDDHWNSFDDATDAAWDYIEQIGGVSELSDETLSLYFNYEAYGRDMDLEGTFRVSEDGNDMIELIW